ncbi:IDEAL domain-containing protein [Pseudalkalibacillus caeni]|uniref:IDEAL domain-containing protein n=1 Tax=Exobacillus caeni TaxID=2574798 RepID=A0A5R9EWW0_9BACL|nr:IDEAL domain-containing protein [Pseudalkalibacillus caeni]TLS35351.1 IDEAL domain-containing protein [Pseudalkalibacillus caeni]
MSLTNSQEMNLKAGDWVKGNSINDELFKGYVEALNETLGTVRIRVVDCDNNRTVGKTIETFVNHISKMPEIDIDREGYLHTMIDLALMTKDKKWFDELTDELNQLDMEKKSQNESLTY